MVNSCLWTSYFCRTQSMQTRVRGINVLIGWVGEQNFYTGWVVKSYFKSSQEAYCSTSHHHTFLWVLPVSTSGCPAADESSVNNSMRSSLILSFMVAFTKGLVSPNYPFPCVPMGLSFQHYHPLHNPSDWVPSCPHRCPCKSRSGEAGSNCESQYGA